MKYLLFLLVSGLMLIISSCKKDEVTSVSPQFVFKHNVDGIALLRGVMNYTNLAGNQYQVDELQYFISEITLQKADGQLIKITSDSSIHYIDLDVPASLAWNPEVMVPAGDYTGISFVFGINEAKNKSGLFVNPPERDMFWPEMMGGGFHCMKMNGKWKATGELIQPFNFHIGIGMNMAGTEFYQNHFTLTLPLNMQINETYSKIDITMNIEKWFAAPNLWDWNVIGGQIMMNQMAMRKAAENGANAFHVSFEGNNPK